jgi:phage shock protein A
LARKMVQIAASVQQLTEELAQSNDRFQSSVDALRRDVTILQEHCHGSGGGSCQ